MGKKKTESTSSYMKDGVLDLNQLVLDIDGAEVLESSKVLTTRKKVRTPIEVVNCLFGGGKPYGTCCGAYGPPTGGKSTEAYEEAAEFLRQEPNGIVIIVDQEMSADPVRLSYLGLDIKRIVRLEPSSINTGFTKLIETFNKLASVQEQVGHNIPLFVVWDTISKGRAEDGEEASRMDARNRARIIKSRMSDISPYLERMDIVMVLLNQVIVTTDKYGNSKNQAGGGIGLSHDEHIRFYIDKNKTIYDSTGIATRDQSTLDIAKSKVSPKMVGIPIVLDVTKGGLIDEYASFLSYFYEKCYLGQSGGWYVFTPIYEMIVQYGVTYYDYFLNNYNRKYRYNDLEDLLRTDRVLYNLLRLALMDIIGNVYELQRRVMKDYYLEIVAETNQLLASQGVVIPDDPRWINLGLDTEATYDCTTEESEESEYEADNTEELDSEGVDASEETD